eukprot:7140167-Prymnesium_polylepis.2
MYDTFCFYGCSTAMGTRTAQSRLKTCWSKRNTARETSCQSHAGCRFGGSWDAIRSDLSALGLVRTFAPAAVRGFDQGLKCAHTRAGAPQRWHSCTSDTNGRARTDSDDRPIETTRAQRALSRSAAHRHAAQSLCMSTARNTGRKQAHTRPQHTWHVVTSQLYGYTVVFGCIEYNSASYNSTGPGPLGPTWLTSVGTCYGWRHPVCSCMLMRASRA